MAVTNEDLACPDCGKVVAKHFALFQIHDVQPGIRVEHGADYQEHDEEGKPVTHNHSRFVHWHEERHDHTVVMRQTLKRKDPASDKFIEEEVENRYPC